MKKITRIISLLLLIAMAVPALAFSASVLSQSEYEAMKKQREELAAQNAELSSKLQGMNAELAVKYTELQANLEASNNMALKEQSYSELLASCMERYNAEKELLAVTTEMMNSINGEISKLEERRTELEESIVETVRNLHETGNAGFFEFILESNGLLDLLNRLEYVTSIMEQYDRLVKDAEENTKILEDRYTELEVLRNTQQETLALLESRKESYDAIIAECVTELETLNSQSSILKTYIDAQQSGIADIEKQLSDTLSQLGSIDELIKDYESESFYWPCKSTKTITCYYGWRELWGKQNLHRGIDIGARYANVYASKGGIVITAEYSSSYGYYMIIAHANGIQTLYAHLSKMNYGVGDSVKGGQIIGVSGNSGWSTGPHLHFEILVNGSNINPLSYKKFGLTGVDSYVDLP